MKRRKPHPEVVSLSLVNLAMEAKRVSTRPAHAARVERHELNVAVERLRNEMQRSTRRQNSMIRIFGSLVVLLACFGVAIGNEWMRWPQAVTTLIGALAFVALFAEFKSER